MVGWRMLRSSQEILMIDLCDCEEDGKPVLGPGSRFGGVGWLKEAFCFYLVN